MQNYSTPSQQTVVFVPVAVPLNYQPLSNTPLPRGLQQHNFPQAGPVFQPVPHLIPGGFATPPPFMQGTMSGTTAMVLGPNTISFNGMTAGSNTPAPRMNHQHINFVPSPFSNSSTIEKGKQTPSVAHQKPKHQHMQPVQPIGNDWLNNTYSGTTTALFSGSTTQPSKQLISGGSLSFEKGTPSLLRSSPEITKMAHTSVHTPSRRNVLLDLDAPLNEDTIMTANTVASLEEFLQDITEPESDPEAVKAIEDLRRELTDKSVRSKLLRMPVHVCEGMVAHLERKTDLLMELLVRERGSIVAPLIEKLGGETTFTILRFVLDNFVTLAKNQSGCIALPRILAHLKPTQLAVFFQATRDHISELFVHPFGNFVVKHFLSNQDHIAALVDCELRSGENLRRWGMNKYGSQLIDEIFRHGNATSLRKLINYMFAEDSLITALAFDSFGNYNLQSVFKAFENVIHDEEFRVTCVAKTASLVRDSPYAQNIMKHALHRPANITSHPPTPKTTMSSLSLWADPTQNLPLVLSHPPPFSQQPLSQFENAIGHPQMMQTLEYNPSVSGFYTQP